MPLQGKFVADFSQFNDAVAKATVSLDNFGKGALNAGRSLQKMVDDFEGKKLIQDAVLMAEAVERIGGTSKLTADELQRLGRQAADAVEKMKLMGIDVPARLQAIADGAKAAGTSTAALGDKVQGMSASLVKAFEDPQSAILGLVESLSGTAGLAVALGGVSVAVGLIGKEIVGLGLDAASVGGHINDLSEKMSMSAESTSALATAVQIAGGDLESFSNFVFQMQKRLQEGGAESEKAAAGLAKIGLSADAIRDAHIDDAILQIAKAFRENTDETNRAGVAFEIAGRQGRDMIPLLMKPLDELVQKSKELGFTWSEEETKAAEELEMQSRLLHAQWEKLWTDIGRQFIPALTDLFKVLSSLLGPLNALMHPTGTTASDEWRKGAAAADLYARAQQVVADQLTKLGPLEDGFTVKLKQTGAAAATTTTQLNAFGQKLGQVQGVTEDEGELLFKIQKTRDTWALGIGQLNRNLDDFIPRLGRAVDEFEAAQAALEGLNTDGTLFSHTLTDQIITIDNWGDSVDWANKHAREWLQTLEDAPGFMERLKTAIDEGIKDLPSEILKAVEGGGNAWKAVGISIGQKIAKALPEGMKSTTMGEVGAGLTAGLAIAASATDKQTKKGQVLSGAATGAKIGTSILPGWGTVVGAGVGALVGALKVSPVEKSARAAFMAWQEQVIANFDKAATASERAEAGANNWAKMQISVRDAYLATGKTAAQAERDIQIALDATHHSAQEVNDALKNISESMDQHAKDTARAKELIDQYGLSVEQLGPAWQKQMLSEQAQQLTDDYRVLTEVLGVSTPLAIEKMADQLNDFAHTAMKTGQEVPDSMRPILQQMVDLGQLTDESGNKITDLNDSGITFAESFSKGVDRIVAALDQLQAAISGTGRAINQLPNEKTIRVNYDVENEPQGFATGGRVLPFRPRGTDTVPAMLSPGEVVLNAVDAAQLRAKGAAGSSEPFPRELLDEIQGLRRELPSTLSRAVRDEVQKVSTRYH